MENEALEFQEQNTHSIMHNASKTILAQTTSM
jgi:hypothetical protein